MHSEHIDVSYFAAGIVAHLASSENDNSGQWPTTIKCTTRDEILQELVSHAGEDSSCIAHCSRANECVVERLSPSQHCYSAVTSKKLNVPVFQSTVGEW